MKSLLIKFPQLAVALTLLAMTLLAGCIADNPEDTDLPWSSNRGWEGMAPISPAITDQYR